MKSYVEDFVDSTDAHATESESMAYRAGVDQRRWGEVGIAQEGACTLVVLKMRLISSPMAISEVVLTWHVAHIRREHG